MAAIRPDPKSKYANVVVERIIWLGVPRHVYVLTRNVVMGAKFILDSKAKHNVVIPAGFHAIPFHLPVKKLIGCRAAAYWTDDKEWCHGTIVASPHAPSTLRIEFFELSRYGTPDLADIPLRGSWALPIVISEQDLARLTTAAPAAPASPPPSSPPCSPPHSLSLPIPPSSSSLSSSAAIINERFSDIQDQMEIDAEETVISTPVPRAVILENLEFGPVPVSQQVQLARKAAERHQMMEASHMLLELGSRLPPTRKRPAESTLEGDTKRQCSVLGLSIVYRDGRVIQV